MSADVLRRAAALMRERAKSARAWDGNWQVHEDKPGRVIEVKGDGWDDAIIASCIDYGGTENGTECAEHIASWHPTVALTVADWLDAVAEQAEQHEGQRKRRSMRSALTVARAYLGESA